MEMSHTEFRNELLKLANSIDETVKAIKEMPEEKEIVKVAAVESNFSMGDLSDRPSSSSNPLYDFIVS